MSADQMWIWFEWPAIVAALCIIGALLWVRWISKPPR